MNFSFFQKRIEFYFRSKNINVSVILKEGKNIPRLFHNNNIIYLCIFSLFKRNICMLKKLFFFLKIFMICKVYNLYYNLCFIFTCVITYFLINITFTQISINLFNLSQVQVYETIICRNYMKSFDLHLS